MGGLGQALAGGGLTRAVGDFGCSRGELSSHGDDDF